MLNKFSQDQFEHILNVLILYNQLTPKTTKVYLNEKSIKEALNFMNTTGKEFSDKLGMQN
tara:strand:- start:406 stop:585 length:180 start_codon:yes stop_codon:yes gene_type:complete